MEEPQMLLGRVSFLETELEAMARLYAEVCLRLESVERELANAVRRRDSVEIGTAGKGGQLKVYFDALGSHDDNLRAVQEARDVLVEAGGIPQVKAPAEGGA